MKTSLRIRTITMSLVALVAFGFASRTFAAVNAYLYIEDAKGQITKVAVSNDGSFTSPSLKQGTYTFSWSLVSKPAGSQAALSNPSSGSPTTLVAGHSISSGGDRPQESIPFNFTKIEMKYEIVSPRDAQSGLPTGKRMHKPFVITKETDKSSPVLYTKLGVVVVDMDNDGISGKIATWDAKGNKSSMDDWSK